MPTKSRDALVAEVAKLKRQIALLKFNAGLVPRRRTGKTVRRKLHYYKSPSSGSIRRRKPKTVAASYRRYQKMKAGGTTKKKSSSWTKALAAARRANKDSFEYTSKKTGATLTYYKSQKEPPFPGAVATYSTSPPRRTSRRR